MNTMVPAYEVAMSDCLGRYTSFYKTVEKFFFPESPIEAITDLTKKQSFHL